MASVSALAVTATAVTLKPTSPKTLNPKTPSTLNRRHRCCYDAAVVNAGRLNDEDYYMGLHSWKRVYDLGFGDFYRGSCLGFRIERFGLRQNPKPRQQPTTQESPNRTPGPLFRVWV